ncbi:hypothetical protein Tco_1231001 [Tanacetum coccineum]
MKKKTHVQRASPVGYKIHVLPQRVQHYTHKRHENLIRLFGLKLFNYEVLKNHVVKPGEAKEPVGGTSKDKTNKEAKTGSSKVNNVSNVSESTSKDNVLSRWNGNYKVVQNVDSDEEGEVEHVYDERATFMASTSSKNEGFKSRSGVGNTSPYEKMEGDL